MLNYYVYNYLQNIFHTHALLTEIITCSVRQAMQIFYITECTKN